MAPIEETKEVRERLFHLEFFQRQQEKDFGVLKSEMCETREIAEEARVLSLQTQAAVEGVPSKVMEALKEEKRANRFEFRDWMQLLIALILVIEVVQKIFS
jgi:hypothetical protein